MGRPSPEILEPALLETQVGHILLEGWRGEEREVGGGVAEVFVEACRQRGEHDLVIDRELQVAELVGEALEAEDVVVEGVAFLMGAEELLLEEGDALDFIVGEDNNWLNEVDSIFKLFGRV